MIIVAIRWRDAELLTIYLFWCYVQNDGDLQKWYEIIFLKKKWNFHRNDLNQIKKEHTQTSIIHLNEPESK